MSDVPEKFFHECVVERFVLVLRGTYNTGTGVLSVIEERREVAPCRAPLFAEHEHLTGVCQACADGRTEPDDEPTEVGKRQIEVSKGGLGPVPVGR